MSFWNVLNSQNNTFLWVKGYKHIRQGKSLNDPSQTTVTAVDNITVHFKIAKSRLKIFSPLANDNYVTDISCFK